MTKIALLNGIFLENWMSFQSHCEWIQELLNHFHRKKCVCNQQTQPQQQYRLNGRSDVEKINLFNICMLIDNITLNLTRRSIGAEFIGTHKKHTRTDYMYPAICTPQVRTCSKFRSNAKQFNRIWGNKGQREREKERCNEHKLQYELLSTGIPVGCEWHWCSQFLIGCMNSYSIQFFF